MLINRGSYAAGFKYLEDIEKTFGKGYTDADEHEIRMLQAEVRLATGKRKDAEKILEDLILKNPLMAKSFAFIRQTGCRKPRLCQGCLTI